jgi:hypothetical protein
LGFGRERILVLIRMLIRKYSRISKDAVTACVSVPSIAYKVNEIEG